MKRQISISELNRRDRDESLPNRLRRVVEDQLRLLKAREQQSADVDTEMLEDDLTDDRDQRIAHLETELARAYRCIRGFWTATKAEKVIGAAPLAYHSPTIAAACRFVAEGGVFHRQAS